MIIDGAGVAVREEGTGEPVLYLHGFPTAGYLWRKVAGVVGSSYRTIAPDYPGYGDSELLKGSHTWEALVEWTDSFVDALDIAPVHLAVHDWGGLIGLAWAAKNPDKVRSLFITDTSFRAKDRWHGLAAEWRKPGVGEELIGSLDLERFRSLIAAFGPTDEEAVNEYFKGLVSDERKAAKLEMYRSLEFEMFTPLEPLLPEVAPGKVRVVWGANDPLLSQKLALRFGDRLGAEVKFVEAGHFLQEERGEEVGRLHLEFLDSLA